MICFISLSRRAKLEFKLLISNLTRYLYTAACFTLKKGSKLNPVTRAKYRLKLTDILKRHLIVLLFQDVLKNILLGLMLDFLTSYTDH